MQIVVRLDVTDDEVARMDIIASRAGLVAVDAKKAERNAVRKAVLRAAARSFLTGCAPIPDAAMAIQWATLDDRGREAVRRALLAEAGRVQWEREAEAFNALKAAEREAKAARRAEVLRRQREQRGNAKHLKRLQRRAEAVAEWGGSGEAVRLVDGLEFAPM